MSELDTLEQAVVTLVAAIQDAGQPVFRSVAGFTDPQRKNAVARIRQQVAPAALVVYDGRVRSDVADSVVGLPKLTVLMSAENLRGGDDVRGGDGIWHGGFELLGMVMAALDGALVETDRRLTVLDEQAVSADETHVVFEQRYLIDRINELTLPTFGGDTLVGSDSLVNVVVGEISSEVASFAFPGIDGVFRHHLGLRSRPIQWRGQLRAATDAALNTIESAIEAAVVDPSAQSMNDSWGRSFADCVSERFVRLGRRRRHPVTGYALQNFEIHFTQLNPQG